MWYAAPCGQAHTARRLLEGTADQRGVEVDRAETALGTTPLLQAATQGFLEVVNVHEADANKASHDGTTPLHFAAQVISVNVAEVLLESRANVNMTDKTMQTPLHLAAFVGHLAVVRHLLQSRADTSLKNQWGLTLPPEIFAVFFF